MKKPLIPHMLLFLVWLIIIPVACYYLSNWWLLFSIAFFGIGFSMNRYSLILVTLISLCVYAFAPMELRRYYIFFFISLLFGFLMAKDIADLLKDSEDQMLED